MEPRTSGRSRPSHYFVSLNSARQRVEFFLFLGTWAAMREIGCTLDQQRQHLVCFIPGKRCGGCNSGNHGRTPCLPRAGNLVAVPSNCQWHDGFMLNPTEEAAPCRLLNTRVGC